jgi:hypothetical protein
VIVLKIFFIICYIPHGSFTTPVNRI